MQKEKISFGDLSGSLKFSVVGGFIYLVMLTAMTAVIIIKTLFEVL